MALPHLHSLWVGPRLDYLERLCIASARSTGHEFTLWSYEPGQLEGVPPNTDLRDAAEVMPKERLLRYRDNGSVALGANLWRIELLAQGRGCWVDMDLIFLKAMTFDTPYIFGWEYENWINNAVLGAPPQSAMVSQLQNIPKANRCPPWYGPRRTAQFYWKRFREGPIELEDFPWGTFSAGLVTHVVQQENLTRHAQSPDVFYPVRWKDARSLYEPAEIVESMLTGKTCTVHMWHSRLEGLKDAPPAKGSFVAKMCDRYGVGFD